MARRNYAPRYCGASPPSKYRQTANCLLAPDHAGDHKNGIEGIRWPRTAGIERSEEG